MIPVRAYLSLLATHLRGLRWRVVAMAATVLAGITLQLLAPQLVKRVIDGALAGQPASVLVPLATWFVVLAFATQGVAVLATWLATDIGWRATNRLRADLTAHVLHLDMGFHKRHTPGELIERVDGDVTALGNFFSAMVVNVVGNGLLVAGIVVLLFRESWVVGGFVLAMTLVLLGLLGRLHDVAVTWWRAVRASSAAAQGQVGEFTDGTEDIRGNGAEAFVQARFTTILRDWLPRHRRGWLGWGIMWGAQEAWAIVVTIGVYWLGARFLDAGTMTIGGIYLVVHYVEMVSRPIRQMRDQLQDLQKAGAAIGRINDLLAVRPGLPPVGDVQVPPGALAVALDGVQFAYDDEPARPVLRGIDVEVAPGRVLGIVGRTGSGKSTLARLVTRLHVADAGEVRLGGHEVSRIANLRDRVAMVTQDVQLVRGSVRDNLTFHDHTIGDDRLHDAITTLGLREWFATLPAGLDTHLGTGTLSAGQAQLLAFTRVFLRDPGLVVLDEASSRLDPATEQLLERAVDRLLAGRTGIIIAHRLHTLHRADDILLLGDGAVVESGPRSRLATDPTSAFSQLLTTGMEEVLA
jgi:ATP-binding cassette subfamily B protein